MRRHEARARIAEFMFSPQVEYNTGWWDHIDGLLGWLR